MKLTKKDIKANKEEIKKWFEIRLVVKLLGITILDFKIPKGDG